MAIIADLERMLDAAIASGDLALCSEIAKTIDQEKERQRQTVIDVFNQLAATLELELCIS